MMLSNEAVLMIIPIFTAERTSLGIMAPHSNGTNLDRCL
jgi:hypothetical protein